MVAAPRRRHPDADSPGCESGSRRSVASWTADRSRTDGECGRGCPGEDTIVEAEETIRVGIVDDQELRRSALRMMVESQPDLDLVGEASDGHQALALVGRRRVDVVLTDLRRPRLDGIEATAAITRELPHTRVVALTTFDLDDYAFPALRAGTSGVPASW